jgi:putative ATPase
LEREDLISIIDRAVAYYAQTEQRTVTIKECEALLRISGGDARKLMNALELVVAQFKGDCVIDNATVCSIVQQNLATYDKKGEQHYDIISAFIKSVRGSDPNAAVYWLARMIAGGEDPLFIARRMIILASEDIGNANPNALLLANACFDAVNKIGMSEGRIILSQTAVYLATSPKSNSTYLAIGKALELVEKTEDLPVPLHLRNAPTKLMEQIGYGNDYMYSHDYQNHFVQQQFMPDSLQTLELYSPSDNPREQKTREELRKMWYGVYKY